MPGDLLEFSKQEQIKLMPHMDEDNPLPIETLQEVLEELQVKERVTEMQWVVKYTAVVKKRGIVDNKGYPFTMNELMTVILYRQKRNKPPELQIGHQRPISRTVYHSII